jgi:serine/threonine-protein kinase
MARVGRLPVRRALHIVRHVLRGLAHAHAAGIVHRDVKPNNVVLVESGGDPDFAKILDFGIAKLVEGAPVAPDAGDQQITRIGTTVGTPTYVAPEQAVGGAVDPRSDLYSLSVMLYEMIAGEPPFRAEDTVKLIGKHLAAAVPAMAEVAPGLVVAPAVEEMIRVGLAKDRASRHQHADAYGRAIDDLIASGEVDPPASMLEGQVDAPPAPVRARPAMAGGTGVIPTASLAAGAAKVGPDAPRVAPPASAARGRLAVVAGGAVLVLVIVIVASTRSGGAPVGARPGPIDVPAARGVPPLAARPFDDIKLARAADQPPVAEAEPAAADDAREDARAELALGHERLAGRRGVEGLEAYRRAIALDPSVADDPTLARNVERLVGARDRAIAMAAVDVLGEMDGEAARDRLVALASGDKRMSIRSRARFLAEKRGAGDLIDRLGSFSLDLAQGRTCEERAEAVPALRALGDRRAIPVLERARKRRTAGLLGLGRRSLNGCMRAQLDEAIAHLQEL